MAQHVRDESRALARTFRGNLVRVFAGQIGFAAIAFVGSLVAARLLGPSGRGELSILILIPSICIVALEFGQESTTSHLAARTAGLRAGLASNALAYGAAVIIPAAALSFAAFSVLDVTSSHTALIAAAAALGIGANVYLRAMAGLALGLGRVGLYNVSRLWLAASFPIAVGALAVAGSRDPVSYFLGWIAAGVSAAVLLALVLGRVRPAVDVDLAADQFRVGLPIHFSNVGQFLLLRADQLVLFAIAGSAAVGYYAIAVNVAEVLWYIPGAAGLVSLPLLSGERDEREKAAALTHALQLSLWLTVAGGLLCAVVSPLLLPLVFGESFRPAVLPLELLLPGVVAAAIVRVAAAALIAREATSLLWRWTVIALGVNLATGVVLMYEFGAVGAAIASSISYALLGCVLLYAVGRVWAIDIRACIRPPALRRHGVESESSAA